MRPKKSPETIARQLHPHYGTRVSLAGNYRHRRADTLWYCHSCEHFFWQNVWSLQQGMRTRCKCYFSDPIDYYKSQKNRKGHRCLPEWDTWDREVPERDPFNLDQELGVVNEARTRNGKFGKFDPPEKKSK